MTTWPCSTCGATPTRRYLNRDLCPAHEPVTPTPDPALTAVGLRERRIRQLPLMRAAAAAGRAGSVGPAPTSPGRGPDEATRRAFAHWEEDEPHLLTLSNGEVVEVPFEMDPRTSITPHRARYFRALVEADR